MDGRPTGSAAEDPAGQGTAGEGPAAESPAAEGPAGEGPAGEGPAGEGPAAESPAAEIAATEGTTVPHHRRIEQALRARIARLQAGDPLPSDTALCAEFGVSRMTARNAMTRLADDGLIERIPGRGSFVAEPPTHRRADRLLTFTHEMRRQGRRPTSLVLAREIRPSTTREAALLGLDHAEPVVLLRRVRCADGQPIAIESAILSRRTAEAVMAADLESGSLQEALATIGIHLRRGTATITADAATYEDARLLGIRRGAPLLVERRIISDWQGRRIEATESRYPAERYALDVQFDVVDTTLPAAKEATP